MEIRFYIDPQSGRPHVENHGITTQEATQAWERARQDYAGHQWRKDRDWTDDDGPDIEDHLPT